MSPTSRDFVAPGQRWGPPRAALHNAWTEAAMPTPKGQKAIERNTHRDRQAVYVWAKSTDPVIGGAVVGLGQPELTPNSSDSAVQPVVLATAPPTRKLWAVAQQGIGGGELIGAVTLRGLAWTPVNVRSVNHEIVYWDQTELRTGELKDLDAGDQYARLIHAGGASGVVFCLVDLLCCVGLNLEGGTGGGTVECFECEEGVQAQQYTVTMDGFTDLFPQDPFAGLGVPWASAINGIEITVDAGLPCNSDTRITEASSVPLVTGKTAPDVANVDAGNEAWVKVTLAFGTGANAARVRVEHWVLENDGTTETIIGESHEFLLALGGGVNPVCLQDVNLDYIGSTLDGPGNSTTYGGNPIVMAPVAPQGGFAEGELPQVNEGNNALQPAAWEVQPVGAGGFPQSAHTQAQSWKDFKPRETGTGIGGLFANPEFVAVGQVAANPQNEEDGTIEGVMVERANSAGGGVRLAGFRNQDPGSIVRENANNDLIEANAPVELSGPVLYLDGTPLLVIEQPITEDHYLIAKPSVQLPAPDNRHVSALELGPRVLYDFSDRAEDTRDIDLDDELPHQVVALTTAGGQYEPGDTFSFGLQLSEEGNRDAIFTIEIRVPGAGTWTDDLVLNGNTIFYQSSGPVAISIPIGTEISLWVSAVKGNPNTAAWVRGSIQPSFIELSHAG